MTAPTGPAETAIRRLRRLVAVVAVAGAVAQGLVALLVHGRGAVAPLSTTVFPWAHGWWLTAVFLVLTCAADWVSVRIRHGEETVELTLFEVACVIDVLVLPGATALLVPLLATMIPSTLRRRGLTKVVFNSGNLAAGVALLVLALHLGAGPGALLSARTVTALTVGMLGLAGVNLVALSRVLGVVGGEQPWRVVRDGARLSVVVAIGTVALGGTAVILADHAPALLPFSLMPVAALMFAYRAAAQESEERERSSRLLALSQVLAGRLTPDELLEQFLTLTRQAFGGDVALAVLEPVGLSAEPARTVLDDHERGGAQHAATAAETGLLRRGDAAAVLDEDLPHGWRTALIAPLEAEGEQMGAVVLASRDRRSRLGARELTLLTPLTSALAVALRGAAHLARLVEETSKLKAVVDHSSDGILVLDGHGAVQLWSPALETLTGQQEHEALGRPLAELMTTSVPDGGRCDPFLVGRALLTPSAPQATVELVLVRNDGDQRVVRCAHAAVFDDTGALVRDVVLVHDVTRERQVERLKADFIATVSHELRTPVTPIKGYADLLRRRGHLMSDAKRAECLEVISDRAAHLARLVEDLLLASRISATEGNTTSLDMASDDLAGLVRRAAGDFGDQGHRIALVVPEGTVPVHCDPVRVIQVLTNMIGNALKYSAAGTPVVVRLVSDGARARVEVQDVGRGIPADQLERVFDKFHRVEDPMLMTTGGTGLGLYIARSLATAMGGTLSCTSTLGVGSVFTFTLETAAAPAAPAPDQASTATPATAPADGPRRTPPWAVIPPRPTGGERAGAPQPLG